MSVRSGPRERSERNDLGRPGHIGDGFAQDGEPLCRSDETFLEDDELSVSGAAKPEWPEGLRDGQKDRQSLDEAPLALSGTLAERIELLRERIETLQRATARRRRPHRFVQRAIGVELREVDFLLDEVRIWSLGVNASVDRRRTDLEREAIVHPAF